MSEHDWVGEHCPGPDAVAAPPSRSGPGRGEGAGGTAETVSGPLLGVPADHVPGRLDRILAETAAKPHLPDPQAWWLAPGVREQHDATVAENYRLRAIVAALEAECAALASEVDATRHDFVPDVDLADRCGATFPPGLDRAWCGRPADARLHRTAARVRAEHGLGAT